MGLESGNYITDLVATNPPGSDPKSQGDDHLRLLKKVLLNTFPDASRAYPLGDFREKIPQTDNEAAAGVVPVDITWSPGDVRRYGAVGDGASLDTAAILDALKVGGDVVFPPGVYVVDGTLLRLYSGTTIWGYGATLRLASGAYSAMCYFLGTNEGITWDAGYETTTGVSILGITLDGNIGNVTTSSSCYGINAYKTSGFLVRDVHIVDLPGTIGGGYGVAFSFSDDCQAVNCNIDRTDRQNIVVWETTNAKISGCTLKDSYFRDCLMVSSNTPAVFQSSECILVDSKCTNGLSSGTHVIRFSGQARGRIDNVTVRGFQSGASGLHGVYITDVYPKNVVISNTTIDDCYRGIEVSSDAQHHVTISNCHIGMEIPCYDGIRVNTNGASCAILGSLVSAANIPLYVNAADHQSITGNTFIGGADNSVVFSEATGSTVFAGNTLVNNTDPTYPILFGGNGTPVIVGNSLVGNTVNHIRASTNAIAAGNTAQVVDGVVRSGATVKRSTTPNRPTLGAADIGYLFMDTTLDADGKPIWWTGTVWVDATGGVV